DAEARDREGVLRLPLVRELHRDGRAGLGLRERRLEVVVVRLDRDLARLDGLLALVGDLALELDRRGFVRGRPAPPGGEGGGRRARRRSGQAPCASGLPGSWDLPTTYGPPRAADCGA